ncbi:MAG: ESPR-type extended signal peptide-containing protein [Veillonella sp.]|uniref:ESPR-type extended signal peptide-containing protein n=1 Tax=Veillonella sp. TaxID=1926307 RepID=UPI0029090E2D|nr:ESPR-type extended signal peptide-containing protein [Veillonella sp.]MDU6572136.1 ESPR-type extended signal peptide-containing protein [Veillonella sp.]
MNKIFKVVWSKTKECYVVVSEVAKNNGGKKKVLASVLAGLAMVGAGAQVQAYSDLGGHDNPAVETLAVGPDTWANQEAAVAVGMHNNANGQPAGKHSVAIGSFSNANGEISIAMGGVTNASGKMSVAVGYRASATDEAAVALGNMVSADKNSTGVGPGATASGTYAFAGGYQSETTGISGVAIGDNAKAKAARAMAIGGHAEATAEQAIAIGSDTGAGNKTTASKKNAIAVGHGATASGLDTAAIGTSATASGQSSVALGNGTQSTNLNTTAIGSNVQSTKTGSIGIGGNVESIGDYSVAIGSASAGKTVKAVDYATAVGGLSNAAERAAALGAGADAAQARSVAIGYKATASTADGVAIGSTSVASTAAGVQGFNPADSRTNKYGGLTSAAQTSTLAAVSIGNGSAQTRQITGLAAGKEDTDAVNVAQLRSVNLKYAADTGNSDFLLTDGTLTVNGDGDLISTSVESTGAIKVTAKKGGNITHTDGKAVKPTTNGIATTNNVVDAINDSYWKATAGGNTDGTPSVGNVKPGTQVTYSAGDNLKVKQTIAANGNQEYKYSLNPVLTGITSIANTTTGPKMTFGGNSINITGGSLDMGNNKITNLATGTDDKDAVNVKQLKDTEIHITPGTYTPDSNKKVTLTYENGDNKTVAGKTAVIDLSGLATGGTASTESVVKKAAATGDTNIADVSVAGGKAVNDPGAQYEVSVSKNAVKDAAREAVTVNNGGNTDNPISVTPTQDNTNHNTTYAVTFDGNKAAKQIPLTYKATNGTTTTADQTVKLDKGLNFTGGDYTTASVGADGKVTFDVNLGTAPTVTDGKPGVPGQAGATGKDGIATVKTVVDTINNSGWKANAKANGGNLDGSSTATVVKPGDQVNFAAGKNLTVKQDLTGEHTYTYSLNKDLKDLTSVEIGGSTIKTDGDHITITSPDTNPGATPGATVTNKVANLGDEKHIKPDTYAVANDGSVTLKYVDGNGKDLTETTKITGIAKKAKVINGKNTTVEEGTDTSDNSVTYKVNVKGALADISSITNGTGSGKISFEGDQVVKVGGDHPISFDGKGGYVTGLQNKDWDITNPTVVSGRAATEDQLKKVSDGFNNTVKLTGNSGATGTQKLNQNGGLSFGVVGADNGKYITTTASGSNVVADLSTDAKNKLNSKVVVAGSGAATVAAPTVTTNPDGSTVTTYTVHVDPATATAASTESVVKKAATGDTNIADVSVADGKATGDVGAKYEVSVSRNAVKDAAREAVTINNGGTKSGTTYTPNADNPITVTPKEDAGNHNTTYEVTFDGNKAAKQIPLTYKATNDGTTTADQTVKLDKGLNFTGGNYTTASVGADGKVTFDVKLGTAPTVTDGKPGVPGQAGAAGKDGIATVKTVVDTINNSGWKANAKANGGNLDGSATATVVKPGNTVNYAAGKNITVKQELETDASNALTGNQTYTYSLNKDIDLTNAGSLTVGDTTVNNGGITIKAPTPAAGTTATTTDVKLTNTGLDNGGNKIVNVAEGKADTDAVNVKQLKDAKTVLVDGKNTTKSGTGTAADPYKVNVEGDLTGISSITNDGTNNGKISFGPNKTVTVDGDHSITLNASTGKIGGLQNKTFDPTNFTSGQAATEDQLKSVHDTLKASELHIAPTAGTTNNVAEYTVDANNKVTLTYQDGNGTAATAPKAVIDLSALANKITSGYTFNTNAIAKGGAVDGSASVKAVDNGGTINYAAGKNLTVKQEIDTTNKTQTYTYSLNKDINVETVTVTGQNGKDGKIGINGKDGVTRTISVEVPGQTGQPGTPGVDGTTTTRIVFDDKAQANLDDGLKFTGNNESTENKHKLNTLVKVQGEGTKEGTNAAGTKEIQTSDGTKFESAKDNIAVVADGTNTLTVKLNKNLKGLDSVQTKTVELGDHTTPGGTTNITYNSGDKRIEYTTPGATAGTPETKKVATTDDIWTIQGNGTDVAPVNGKVNVKAGENILITTPTTADGSMTINAVTPAVYTDKNGNKLTKDKDGKFHKDDGTEVAAADVITSIQDAAGNVTGGNSIVNNVGSAIQTQTGGNFLEKLDKATDTTNPDARPNAVVNVSDLKNTADGLTNKGLKFDANEGGVKTNKLGSTVTVQGSGALTAGKAYADEYNTANIRTKIEQGGNGNTTINVGLAKELKGINSISNGTSSITLNSNPGGTSNTPAVSITGGNLSMGNNKIVNLAPGTADTDAVNVKQLKDTELHITPGTYTPDTNKKVTLTYTDGNSQLVTGKEAVIDLSGLSTGGATASTWNVKSSANTTDGGAVDANHNANAQNIADGKSVEFQAGKNLVVKQTNDTTNGNATVEFSLSDNITVGKDGANGKEGSVGAKGTDGSAVVMNGKDGSIGLNGTNGANGISIKGKDGANGVGIDGKDGVTRIVYTEKVPDPATGTTKEVTHEVATMDDGLKFTGNNTSTENKQKLGSLVKIQGEGTKESTAVDPATGKKYVVLSDGTTKFESAQDNIAVEADGTDTLTVKLNKNLKGLNSIQLGDNTIKSDGDTIKFDTKNSGTKTVATTDQLWTIQANGIDVPATNGKVNVVGKDGITVAKNTAGNLEISGTGLGKMNSFDVTANNGATSKTIDNGKKVDFNAGSNLTVKQSNDATGTHIEYALNKDVNLGNDGSLTTGNTTVKDNGVTITNTDPTKTVSLTNNGLNNGGNQITNVASGGNVDTNAANIGDIKRLAKDTRIKDDTYTVDSNGTVELTYVDGNGDQVKDASGKAITAKITGLTTLDSTRVNVAVNKTGTGEVAGSTAPVKVTKGTEFVAGNNLIVERTAHTGNDLDNSVVYSLNSNLTGITSISNTATGPKMTFGGNNVNFTGGDVKISNGNLDMNNNKITNVGKGTDSKDAANVGQLTQVKPGNSSVTVGHTVDPNTGANIYTITANPAGTVDLTNVNNRVDQLGEEIGRVGAQGAALSALKPIQYDPLEPTQIMAGYGNYRGNSAVALGVAHYKNESTLIHGGVSWAGGSSHMMANAGVTWKVGNRDSEAAVADRYRKGPISSAYAMQQEMAAMKAQNAGLKGEVSDLKAENEQMKAQIAAMMAKLGL